MHQEPTLEKVIGSSFYIKMVIRLLGSASLTSLVYKMKANKIREKEGIVKEIV